MISGNKQQHAAPHFRQGHLDTYWSLFIPTHRFKERKEENDKKNEPKLGTKDTVCRTG